MAIQSTITTGTTVISADTERKVMRSKVSDNGAARIASMVVNMYADPTSAVTREYIANAVDATIAAGSKSPVHVTVPTILSPTLVVKDNGTGMDALALEHAFLAFAESTKGDTNDQVGGLGVGAKSAWTICESFIVDTIKDGKRNVVRAARDLEHEVMVSDADTDLPNGTTITIPVTVEGVSWRDEILKVAMFHKPGAVLVDGAPVASVHSGRRIGPVRLGRVDSSMPRLTVLSGGTMFGVPSSLTQDITSVISNVSLTLELEVGSFSNTPNRDYLIADARTKDALKAALRKYTRAHDTVSKRLVSLAKTDVSAAISMREEYMNGERSRNVLSLPYHIDLAGEHTYTPARRGSRTSVWSSPRTMQWSVYETGMLRRAVVVTDVPAGKKLKGIGRYMDTVHPTACVVIAVPQGEDAVRFKVTPSTGSHNSTFNVGPRTPGVTAVTYAEMVSKSKELSALAAASRVTSPEKTYYVSGVLGDTPYTATSTLEEVAQKVSAARQDGADVAVLYGETHYRSTLARISPSARFVVIDLGRRSVKPVLARFPDAMNIRSYRENLAKAREQEVTDEDIARFLLREGAVSSLSVKSSVACALNSSDNAPRAAREGLSTLAFIGSVDTSEKLPVDVVAALEDLRWGYGYTARASRMSSAADAEWDSLCAAYPLLGGIISAFQKDDTPTMYSEKIRHAVDYVTSVAPVAQHTDI